MDEATLERLKQMRARRNYRGGPGNPKALNEQIYAARAAKAIECRWFAEVIAANVMVIKKGPPSLAYLTTMVDDYPNFRSRSKGAIHERCFYGKNAPLVDLVEYKRWGRAGWLLKSDKADLFPRAPFVNTWSQEEIDGLFSLVNEHKLTAKEVLSVLREHIAKTR